MKEENIYALYPKKKQSYPKGGMEHRYATNVLARQFNPSTHNTHWVTDVTYIRSHQGWSYLACVMDLATKKVVGMALSRTPDAKLTLAALEQAIMKNRPEPTKLMVHSDQGCQYSAKSFRDKLKNLGIQQSMSRRGNCWDNAVMERLFRSLKCEHLYCLKLINHQSVITECERYIAFYNDKRLHSGLNYITPHERYRQMKKSA